MDIEKQLKILIAMALKEDGERDITTEFVCEDDLDMDAVLLAKQDGVVCGLKFLDIMINTLDELVFTDIFLNEGDSVKDRMIVASFHGASRTLLRLERIILNFLSRLSGIATQTQTFVQLIEGTGAVILDTRKTIPGWRFLDKYAVVTGGGINHRMNLEEVALIKDTHTDLCGGVGKAIEIFRKQNADADAVLMVEVRDMEEFAEAMSQAKSLNRIILDNFSLEMMREAVELASGRVLLEASGGVTLENARKIAETGVHFLSVGALTHSPKAFDFSFQIS